MGATVAGAQATLIGGWAVGPVVGRRPAGPLREAIEPLTRRRAVFVLVDDRFRPAAAPDPDTVIRAAGVEHRGIAPLLDAGLLDDGTPWYVCDALPGPVLDPEAGCSPRRALTIAEEVAQALAALHAEGVVHGLVSAATVVPGAGRHRDGSGPSLLLDVGVRALVGSGATALAGVAGVSLPADRGPAADVYALGALLLRMLTAAAPAAAALAALPVDVRALLSSMLDPDPAHRPTAGATAARLASLREGVPSTGAIPRLPATVPARRTAAATGQSPAVTAQVPAPAPPAPRVTAPAPAIRQAAAAPVTAEVPTTRPAPLAAPRTATSPIAVPRSAPDPARSLRTGPVPVAAPAYPRPARVGAIRTGSRGRAVRRLLVAAGGVGLAGLLVTVVAHLPSGEQAGVHAVAAGAGDALGIGAGTADRPVTEPSISSRSSATGSPATSAPARIAAAVAPSPAPVFLRPVATAAPLAAARGDSPPAPAFLQPTTPPTPMTTVPASAAPSTPATSDPATSEPATASPASSPSDTPSATGDPTRSADPSPSSDPTRSADPTESPSPSDTAGATPSDTASPSDDPSASSTPDPSDSTNP